VGASRLDPAPSPAGRGLRPSASEARERRQVRVGRGHPGVALVPNGVLAPSLRPAHRAPSVRGVSGETRARHPRGRGRPHDGARPELGWNVTHVVLIGQRQERRLPREPALLCNRL
jgi:hypothetical protein